MKYARACMRSSAKLMVNCIVTHRVHCYDENISSLMECFRALVNLILCNYFLIRSPFLLNLRVLYTNKQFLA